MSATSNSQGHGDDHADLRGRHQSDIAQVQVQNKVQLAVPLLPQEVQQQGVQVNKSVAQLPHVVGLYSPKTAHVRAPTSPTTSLQHPADPISRLPGVGDIQIFGTQYAMRIWLDPDKLTKYQLDPGRRHRRRSRRRTPRSPPAQLGALPSVPGQLLNATIMAQSRLQTPEQFGAILLRVSPDGSRVFLRDVARVELGSESYNILARYQRQARGASGMASAARAPTRSKPWTR